MKSALKYLAYFLLAALPALFYLVETWPGPNRFTDGARDFDEGRWHQASRFLWTASAALEIPGIDVVEPAGVSPLDGAFYFSGRSEAGWDLYRLSGRGDAGLERLARLSSAAGDRDLSLSADGRRLYFASDRSGGAGGYDLYCSHWQRDDFEEPQRLNAAASPLDERRPTEMLGGELLFTRLDENEELLVLRADQLAYLPAPWPSDARLGGMALTRDGRLFFALRESGAADFDLYRSLGDGIHFGPAKALSELNTEADETNPQFDGDHLWFRRAEHDLNAVGSNVAERAQETEIEVWAAALSWKSALWRSLMILAASLLLLLLLLRWRQLHPFFKFLLVSLILHLLAMLFVDPIGESEESGESSGRSFQVTWLGERSDSAARVAGSEVSRSENLRPASVRGQLTSTLSLPHTEAQALPRPRRSDPLPAELVAGPQTPRPEVAAASTHNIPAPSAALAEPQKARPELVSATSQDALSAPRLAVNPERLAATPRTDSRVVVATPKVVVPAASGRLRERLGDLRELDAETLKEQLAVALKRESSAVLSLVAPAGMVSEAEKVEAQSPLPSVGANDRATALSAAAQPGPTRPSASPWSAPESHDLTPPAGPTLRARDFQAARPSPGLPTTSSAVEVTAPTKPSPILAMDRPSEMASRAQGKTAATEVSAQPLRAADQIGTLAPQSTRHPESAQVAPLSEAGPDREVLVAKSFVRPRGRLMLDEEPEASTVFASRHGRLKAEALALTGGSGATEAAVLAGLQYLQKVQNRDGSWGHARLHDKYGDRRAGKTGLALLAFLGAGYDQRSASDFSAVVAQGLKFLIAEQAADNGHLGQGSSYGHGIAAYALAEAFASSQDQALREPLRRAVKRILAAQYHDPGSILDGGWGYFYRDSERRFDNWPRLSVTVWQVMALKSAELGGLSVPKTVLARARQYLLNCEDPQLEALRYNHDPAWRRNSYPTLPGSNSAALFAMQLLEVEESEPAYQSAFNFVRVLEPRFRWRTPSAQRFVNRAEGNLYFHYYAALAMHRRGGDEWAAWNQSLKPLLLNNQNEDGSWRPISNYADYAGDTDADRSYTTAICVLMLEVYYRYFSPLLAEMDRNRPAPTEAIEPKQKFEVAGVKVGSEAFKAGLRDGDFLIALDDLQLEDTAQLRTQLALWDHSRAMTLTLIRAGVKRTIGPVTRLSFELHVQ